MKKILLSVAASLSLHSMMAQAFFQQTTYRGAFAPAPAPMWTDSWCEWDPQNKTYPAPTVTVSANITGNTTWFSGQTVLLQGPVYVTNNAVLTIQPGVIVLGSKAVSGSALIITRGAKIEAAGTAASPIVFTSDQAAGSRAVGDWGGVILLGNAAINNAGGVNNVEGLPVTANSQFGGGSNPDNNDNSGTLQYVRIEFGGYVYGVNQEINGLTLGGVGKATTIDHVQVSFTNDDGFEWFGGNVSAKYLVSYRNLDDDFDTDNGWSGNVQFGLIVRDPALADNPSVSTSEGFESDNDANGTSATPQTSGIFSNITLVGPYRGATSNTIAAGYRRAARLRRNSGLKIFNSILMDTQRGVHVDGSAVENNIAGGIAKFKHNIIAGTAQRVVEQNSANTFAANVGMSTAAWFASAGNDSINSSDPSYNTILTTPYNYFSPDYRPAANSQALATASFTDAAFNGLMTGIRTEVERNIGHVMLAPNPASEATSLIITSGKSTVASAQLIAASGSVMAELFRNQHLEAGSSPFSISTAHLPPGVYFIVIESGQGKDAVKLLISK